MRYKATIEYDGSFFCGFQKQKKDLSVQEAIETALLSLTRENVRVHGSGRTDSGVHALGQVIHFDLEKHWQPHQLMSGLNFYLNNASVLSVEPASNDFHARFSATQRKYIYRIMNRAAPLTTQKHLMWLVKKSLDVELMQQGAKILCGAHDFNAFRDTRCQAKSPQRCIDEFTIHKAGNIIESVIAAKSFLHHQVRIMMGTLVLLGQHKITLDKFISILDSKDRTKAGPTAPPQGLYFVCATY